MLANQHARRESIEETSEDLLQTHTQLFSYPPSTSAVSPADSFSLLWSMPLVQCPVLGCGSWSSSWGKESYPLPSADILTLRLDSTIDTSINHRICQPCWERSSAVSSSTRAGVHDTVWLTESIWTPRKDSD